MPVFLHPLEPASDDRVGAPEWRQRTRDTVNAAQQLTERCSTNAVSVWQPCESVSDPNVNLQMRRRNRKAPWRFRVEMLKGGGTVEQPPPGDGVTLWKEKLKPPAWQATIPLPLHREARAMQTNEHIQNYVRGVRLLAARLRQAEQEINGQLRAVMRQREITDYRLSEIRKGLLINEQSRKIRLYRPASEKIPDKADTLLLWEKEELRGLKRKMEKDMETSETLLKALNKCRDDLTFCCEERLRVVDLMNHCLDSVLVEAGRQSWINISRIHTPKVQGTASPPVNPVGVNPPECNLALNDAKRLLAEGKIILEKMIKSEHHAHTWQLHINKSVRNSLSRKMEETLQLKERLSMMNGLMRGTIHRCKKFKEEMLITQALNKGPVCEAHLETREKLERPIVRVFQRHVGTQLPEASHLTLGTEKLKRCIISMEKDLEKLNSSRKHLNVCLRQKNIGRKVDYDVARLRVRQSHPHVSYEQVQRMCHD
ncbi:coiled-coil domain-containing protein 105 [Dromiciops gliroides]|uniref:coiled-coil domain-containing protein 105 n=1 Tax=Dromiciops gliroides TaxID=33562 RepID=UPI001CC79739|nr:coiled-coil domain-containing protein 105 [Dromiciops gliroides]